MRAAAVAVGRTPAAREASHRLPLTLRNLLCYLAAITIFGKGPTYLGLPPIYWGEMVLVAALVWMGVRTALLGISLSPRNPLDILVMAFVLLGGFMTALSLLRFESFDVLRDSAVWYYALFYFVGLHVASRPAAAGALWKRLQTIWLITVGWVLVNVMSDWRPALSSPVVSDREVPVLSGSGSENVQAMFLGSMLVLLATDAVRRTRLPQGLLLAAAILGIAAAYSFPGRGVKIAILAAALAAAATTFFGRRSVWPTARRLFLAATLVAILIGVVVLLGPGRLWEVGHFDRFLELSSIDTWGTAHWRLLWWANIHAAVMEVDPVFGLGFGNSLGEFNPYLDSDWQAAWPVRSPHNISMTIYGRMGWAGLLVWVGIVIAGLSRLFLRVRDGGGPGGRYTLERHKELTFWLMMLVATLVNSSFGVLMEGPVLGVWFWFALGFASERACGTDGLEVDEGSSGDALEKLRARGPLPWVGGRPAAFLS